MHVTQLATIRYTCTWLLGATRDNTKQHNFNFVLINKNVVIVSLSLSCCCNRNNINIVCFVAATETISMQFVLLLQQKQYQCSLLLQQKQYQCSKYNVSTFRMQPPDVLHIRMQELCNFVQYLLNFSMLMNFHFTTASQKILH